MIHTEKSNCKWSLLETLWFCDVGGEGESENDTDCNMMVLFLNTGGDFHHLGDEI